MNEIHLDLAEIDNEMLENEVNLHDVDLAAKNVVVMESFAEIPDAHLHRDEATQKAVSLAIENMLLSVGGDSSKRYQASMESFGSAAKAAMDAVKRVIARIKEALIALGKRIKEVIVRLLDLNKRVEKKTEQAATRIDEIKKNYSAAEIKEAQMSIDEEQSKIGIFNGDKLVDKATPDVERKLQEVRSSEKEQSATRPEKEPDRPKKEHEPEHLTYYDWPAVKDKRLADYFYYYGETHQWSIIIKMSRMMFAETMKRLANFVEDMVGWTSFINVDPDGMAERTEKATRRQALSARVGYVLQIGNRHVVEDQSDEEHVRALFRLGYYGDVMFTMSKSDKSCTVQHLPGEWKTRPSNGSVSEDLIQLCPIDRAKEAMASFKEEAKEANDAVAKATKAIETARNLIEKNFKNTTETVEMGPSETLGGAVIADVLTRRAIFYLKSYPIRLAVLASLEQLMSHIERARCQHQLMMTEWVEKSMGIHERYLKKNSGSQHR